MSYAPPVSTTVATPDAAAADPEFIAKGDLNNDGNIDLVTVNESDSTVTVLLSNGAGGFSSVLSYAVRNTPRQVAIGDLNGDTYNDLVVPNVTSGNVTVYLNDNDGTFTEAPESPIALGGGPTAPVIADFNGGAGLDLAITDADTNSVHILFGDGDGTFTPGTPLTVGPKPLSMAAGNLNNALGTDLVVANYDADNVSVFLGDGAGGFTLSQTLTTGAKPWSVHIASIEDAVTDPAGNLDLVLANYNSNTTVRVYKGLGDGTFNTTVLSQTDVQANKPHGVEIADLDNDTNLDVVVANDNELASPATANTTGVTVLSGDGTGAFPIVTHYPVSGQPNSVVSLHLGNANPLLDLAVANGITGKVDVLLSVPTTTAPVASDDTLAVTEDTATNGTLTATDADGALLSYSIVTNGTKGIAVITDAATGAYTYTPNQDMNGGDTFTFKANDGTADSNTATITVTITADNDAPTITGTPATSVNEDEAYSFTPTGADVDVGDTLTYSITNKPSWASFSTTTGALTGTPTNADVGTTTGIVISVSDGIAAPVSLASFNLQVINVNDAPTITGTPATSVNEDAAYSFTPTGADVDVGASLTYSITNKPTWATFSTITGALTGTPVNADVGTTTGIVISVDDGIAAPVSLASFDLEVVNVNDAPTISGTPATNVVHDTAYSFTPTASDVDVGDTLTYSINTTPSWASFNTTTGALTGTPTNADVGTTTGIVISVSDGIAAPVSLAAFDLRVVGVVTVRATDATATEAGRTTGRFTFTRTGSTAAALTVNYIVGGNATAGRDYASLGSRITFPIGASTVTRTVMPIQDTLQEFKETVILSLSQSPNYAVGSARRATVIITSDETVTRVITVAASDATATEAGPTTGRFTFTRTGSTAAGLTVNYIVGGTATAGSDYRSLGTRVYFPIGARTVIRTVTPINDTLQELSETVILRLYQSPNYAVGSASRATVTIIDND